MLEAAIAEVIAALPPGTASDSRDFPEGHMKLKGRSGLEEVCNWAIQEASVGTFGDVLPSALAQAVLPSDEPWLLTASGLPAEDKEAWPTDNALEALCGKRDLEDILANHACAGIQEHEEVLAAELRTYSRDRDVVFRMATHWTSTTMPVLSETRQPSTFNGRTYLYYEPTRYEPGTDPKAGWLTFNAGGLGMFFHTQVSPTPTKVWDTLGWKPTPTNPFVWLHEGKPAVRFEVRLGPVREAIHEPLYRQPVLLRWIISRKAKLEAEERLGVTLQDFKTVEVLRGTR
jgi:hypothetical protein